MFILSREEMQELDRHTMEDFGIPSSVLMENAGKSCAEKIIEDIEDDEPFFGIFCGHGNNGGDGFVIARWLDSAGYSVGIVFVGDEEKMTPETRTNYELCRKLDIPFFEFDKENLPDFDMIIDAIFGIGFHGEMREEYQKVIHWINESPAEVYAIDIPSGLDANTGEGDWAIVADETMTMAAPKYGHFLCDGGACTGELTVIDIGIPPQFFYELRPRASINELPPLPIRTDFSHKGVFGRVSIFAGSPGFSGAAVLASRAALRSGAGIIKLYHTPGMDTIYETKLTEVMTHPIPYLESGALDRDRLITEHEKTDAILIGPGLGTGDKAMELMEFVLNGSIPTVIDADGINCIAQNETLQELLKEHPDVLLTPHMGEFARLMDVDLSEVETNVIGLLMKFHAEFGCPILLKSNVSVFFDGELFTFNINGNNGLATGGSGDVLAGIITSFVAQGHTCDMAAVAGSWLMGFTADSLALKRGTASIIPSDIIDHLFDYDYLAPQID